METLATTIQSIQVMNQDLLRLDCFDGKFFTQWQQKVLFFLTTLKLAYILKDDLPPIPDEKEGESNDIKEQRKKRFEDDFLCKGHILNALSTTLYNTYRHTSSAKELWMRLENKYKTEEVSARKFLIDNYIHFCMVDGKSVLSQVEELQLLMDDITPGGVKVDEEFQVGVIIAKLPPSWKDYKKKLKHQERKCSLEDLLRHLRIEEESRNRDFNEMKLEYVSKAHMVEGESSDKPKKFGILLRNDTSFKKKKTQASETNHRNCFFCQKPGHIMKNCRLHKKFLKCQVNVTDGNTDFTAVVTEANHVDFDEGWWLDTGATIHVAKSRSAFATYENVSDGQHVRMGNNGTAKVMGIGSMELNFTSGKTVTLKSVRHVPEMNKNLVSGDLLNKAGFKLVYESDKFILSKSGIFVGKGYSCNGMIKLNI